MHSDSVSLAEETYAFTAAFEVADTEHNHLRGNLYLRATLHPQAPYMQPVTITRYGSMIPKPFSSRLATELWRLVPFASWVFPDLSVCTKLVEIQLFDKFSTKQFPL